ncbi:hypothetical protein [Shimia sp. MMG029]|uniref:hypothetical protein n=1 Tax=Shimia sp. MMG029 TaxID=3021978 RepID=UPI0022FE54F8|nr:hypothetical protein [Shimia sp. MMG029]MDA5556529.1 hypothetical protein [Shimia sp. MMG029]
MAGTVLVIGSGPNAPVAKDWDAKLFDHIVVINNAWRVRPDWSHVIYPEDFPEDRYPPVMASGQTVIRYTEYVPQNNAFGGVLFAGGTMAFTAGYWALGALQPDVLAFIGCDMVYPKQGHTHFYGTGAADPLRDDVSLQNLEGKSARLALLAAQVGCACVNLSSAESRLLFPRADVKDLGETRVNFAAAQSDVEVLRDAETALGYSAPSGRYWEILDQIDPKELAAIDRRWLELFKRTQSP